MTTDQPSRQSVTVKVYGIPNCDTVRRARHWLEEHDLGYTFHDYKKHGVDEGRLRHWIAVHGWEALLNRRGTTFRKLLDAEKAGLDAERALALMLAHPAMIKRPVMEHGDAVIIGFDDAAWQAALL
ncbi:ArsC family reductase [Croceicoccus sp. F390]|uniref:ArsC family reductase n=1 Tax=Croceicoccus esteveae TaxID=3075597 RepID=A0ABU2ZI91_9SPHN|nr:ArsC family reductase [Croceicoccus sp. F390]MDT0575748.1 ArsC family reductase [Croceicoccus sp. F390]